jgi:hypothetical protein
MQPQHTIGNVSTFTCLLAEIISQGETFRRASRVEYKAIIDKLLSAYGQTQNSPANTKEVIAAFIESFQYLTIDENELSHHKRKYTECSMAYAMWCAFKNMKNVDSALIEIAQANGMTVTKGKTKPEHMIINIVCGAVPYYLGSQRARALRTAYSNGISSKDFRGWIERVGIQNAALGIIV